MQYNHDAFSETLQLKNKIRPALLAGRIDLKYCYATAGQNLYPYTRFKPRGADLYAIMKVPSGLDLESFDKLRARL